jgi:NAD(P)-dependent dehydrogenase (short-subunit alcohol dehydrogenase family)
MPTLDGKVALVTGGSRGIGFAIARELSGRGARVAIAGTSDGPLRDAEQALGNGTLAVRADVRHYADVEQLVSTTVDKLGSVDILVNNAGVGAFEPAADMSLETWHTVLDTNLTGVFHCCRAVLPHMRRHGGGWIVNISSLAGKNPFANGAAYCASKAALNAFSEALMQEVRQDGVRVAYVLPGSVSTSFMGRAPGEGDGWKLAPEDVALVVADLVSHPSRSLPSRVEIRPSRPPVRG